MNIINEDEIKKRSNEEVLGYYKKACSGIGKVFGVHPLSFAYSDIINDLEEEILRRMNN